MVRTGIPPCSDNRQDLAILQFFVPNPILLVLQYQYSRVEIIWGIAPVRPGPYYGYLSPYRSGPETGFVAIVLKPVENMSI